MSGIEDQVMCILEALSFSEIIRPYLKNLTFLSLRTMNTVLFRLEFFYKCLQILQSHSGLKHYIHWHSNGKHSFLHNLFLVKAAGPLITLETWHQVLLLKMPSHLSLQSIYRHNGVRQHKDILLAYMQNTNFTN